MCFLYFVCILCFVRNDEIKLWNQSMLTYWDRDKMDAISQTTFSNAFFYENVRISIKILLMFVSKWPTNNIPAFVQIIAWRQPNYMPLSEPMILTHLWVTQFQWVILNAQLTVSWHVVIKVASFESNGVTNRRQLDPLFNSLSWLTLKKMPKIRNDDDDDHDFIYYTVEGSKGSRTLKIGLFVSNAIGLGPLFPNIFLELSNRKLLAVRDFYANPFLEENLGYF